MKQTPEGHRLEFENLSMKKDDETATFSPFDGGCRLVWGLIL